jgi:hypothetical protein
MKERKALEAGAGGATGAGTAAAGGTGASAGTAAGVGAITQGASRTKKTRVEEDGLTLGPPALPPTLETVILPASITIDEAARAIAERGGAAPEVIDSRLVYRPMAVGLANVQFVSKKYGVSDETDVVLAIDPPDTLAPPDWDEAELLGVSYGDLNSQPPHDALFEEVPVSLNKATKLKKLSMDFADHLYRSQSVTLFLSPATGIHSKPGEAQRDFVVRCREAARELRDDEIDKLSDKYDKKIDLLRGRIAKKERDVLEDEADYEARKREEMLSAGESVLGVFLGRRSSRALSTAARKRRMTTKAKSDIAETRALVGELREDLAELQEEAREEAGKIATHWEEALDEVEEVKVSPRRTDIDVGLFALGWAPHWRITFKSGDRERRSMIPAYESK